MTVLIVPSWYTPKPNAQLGAFFREQALALKRQGIDVVVADATLKSMGTLFKEKHFKLSRIDDEGLDTYVYTTPSFGTMRVTSLAEGLYYHNLKKIWKRLIKDGKKIDVIHLHSFYPAGHAAIKLGKKYGIPVVFTEHSSTVITKSIDENRVRSLYKCAWSSKAVISVSRALKEALESYVGEKVGATVIPNMVDKRFVYAPERKGGDKFTFISVGNLVPIKRFDLALEAFAKEFAKNDGVIYKIAGDGVLRAELEQKAKALGIADKVEFLGRIDRNAVVELMQGANALVCPSDFETFGVVYIEAMACGLPVIGTRNGGANDIIEQGDGFLVDRGDLGGLSKAMKKMYDEYESFDKKTISENCKARFGEEIVAKRIIQVYDSIMSGEAK